MTPKTNDLLVFSGATQTATTNNFAAGAPFNNVTFANGASAFTVDGTFDYTNVVAPGTPRQFIGVQAVP